MQRLNSIGMYLLNEDTICAPATVPGTGAISVVRVSGGDALNAASSIVRCSPGHEILMAPGYSVRFGRIYLDDGQLLDEVLVSVFRSPHSYTGEDSVEISCHASRYIVDNIMRLLLEVGVRPADPGEFTRRAFLNGKMDLAQAEAVADLIAAQNASAHHVALSQLKGGFSLELKKMRSRLLNIVSLMELELDFSEEEVEFADRGELTSLVDEVCSHIDSLVSSFKLGNAIKNGIPVAIAGATNAGKSTLLNLLVGEDRAIVSDIHGTTRDTIEETMNVHGLLFRFIDTAGLRQTDEKIEQIGIERTYRKIGEAAVVFAMVDVSQPLDAVSSALDSVLSRLDARQQKPVFVLNKMDLLDVHTADDAAARNHSGDIAGSSMSAAQGPFYLQENGQFKIFELDNKNVTIINNIVSCINDKCLAHGVKNAALVALSARAGEGTEALKTAISTLCNEYSVASDTVIVTNLRHIEALTSARQILHRVNDGLRSHLPTDLIAQDIREALYHLGSIVGEISTDEVLGNIFGRFCIGK